MINRAEHRATRLLSWLGAIVIFLLPWQTRYILHHGTINHDPWEYGTISIYAIDLVIGVLLIAVLSWVAQRGQLRLRLTDWLAGLLVVIGFFSLSQAVDRSVGLWWWLQLVQAVLLCIAIGQWRIDRRLLGSSWIAAGLIQTGLALTQWFAQYIPGNRWLGISDQDPATLGVQVVATNAERILRAYGSLPHPNILGGFICIAIIIALVWFVEESQRRQQFLFGGCLVLLTSGLWVTVSRQSWIALAVAISIFVGLTFVRSRIFPARLTIGVGVISITAIAWSLSYPSIITTRLNHVGPLESRSINERVDYADQSLDLLERDWLTGIGAGNYTATVAAGDMAVGTPRPGWAYQPVHTIYLLIMSELGVVGLAPLLILIILILRSGSWETPNTLPWKLGLISVLVIGLFDHYLWSLHIGLLLFWVLAGLAQETDQTLDS